MNKPQPTLGPWEHHFLSGYDRIVGPQGECIAETGRWKDRELPEMHANAAFIVRACNAHEELVKQLRLAQRMLLQTDWRLEEGFMAEIAAAIAKAEGRA